MTGNKYQIVVHLPKSDGFHQRDDRHLAEIVERAIGEGLRDRYVEIDYTRIEKVPPPRDYADIPVGTRVLVTPFRGDDRAPEPYEARVHGYDMHRSKYRLDRHIHDDVYASGGHTWAFVNQVELHPDETDKES